MRQAIMTLAKQISERKEVNPIDKEVHATKNALIDSFNKKDMYYNQINFVHDEHLINYYTYLLKAEDEKIGYLQKLLLNMQVK